MSPLVLGEILGMFLKTLIANAKYPVQGCENLQLPIQTQLSEKRESFAEVFVRFLDSTSNFKHFAKKDDVTGNVFPKIQTVKIFVRKLSQEHRFKKGFGSQHVKASQIFAKFPSEHFYHILQHCQKC